MGRLIRWRKAASSTFSPTLQSINRVTPSSKFRAMRYVMGPPSNMININDLVDIVVLEYHLLAGDQRLSASDIKAIERGSEVGIRGLVAMAEGVPVETQFDFSPVATQHLQVGDQVRGAWLRGAGAGAFGLDPEHAVFQAIAVGVVDQRDLALRVFGQAVVVIPGRHPELRLRAIALQPFVPLAVVEQPGLAVEEIQQAIT